MKCFYYEGKQVTNQELSLSLSLHFISLSTSLLNQILEASLHERQYSLRLFIYNGKTREIGEIRERERESVDLRKGRSVNQFTAQLAIHTLSL